MATFIERTYLCGRCDKEYKAFGEEGLSIVYRHCYLSICPQCTDEVLAAMGSSRDKVLKDWARIREMMTKEKIKEEIKFGWRCAFCTVKFTESDHQHKTTDGTFHTSCYKEKYEAIR